MRRFSEWLIRRVGTRRYLAIPQRLRRRLGMVCGEDMSDITRLLAALLKQGKSDGT